MFVLVAIIQVSAGLGLIFLVLLHSGKGGGLSDMFGGGIGAQTAGSTVVEQNLDRITIVAALVFAFTTIALGLMFSGAVPRCPGASGRVSQGTDPWRTTHSVA